MAQTSGSFNFAPSLAECVVDAFGRIQIFPPLITISHVASARFKANLILSDWAASRGVNLAQVDCLNIPLTPGLSTYVLPKNTVDILDTYLRNFTPSTTTTNLGNVILPLGPAGNPTIGTPFGDPVLITPGSGTLSSVAGSQIITFEWPHHQLSVGSPIFWGCPISIGGLTIQGFSVVETVNNADEITFLSTVPALETQTNQGGTPLFSTTAGSASVDCIQPSHGLAVGDPYAVPISTNVGGLSLLGTYIVASVVNDYEFTFIPGPAASSTASVFENQGQINVATQAAGVQFTDVPMFPLSRNDYVNLSVKSTPGRPTSYWVDRIVPPTLTTYPVAPTGSFYAVAAYRMREFQDAIPVGGMSVEAPRRMWPAFVAALCASLSETYAPEQWAAKVTAAEIAWQRAASADIERAVTHIVPNFSGFFR